MKFIYLEWEDSVAASDAWRSKEESLKWGKDVDWITKEGGWLLEENKKYILFGSAAGGQNSFHGHKKIPKTWIRKRVDLTKYIK